MHKEFAVDQISIAILAWAIFGSKILWSSKFAAVFCGVEVRGLKTWWSLALHLVSSCCGLWSYQPQRSVMTVLTFNVNVNNLSRWHLWRHHIPSWRWEQRARLKQIPKCSPVVLVTMVMTCITLADPTNRARVLRWMTKLLVPRSALIPNSILLIITAHAGIHIKVAQTTALIPLSPRRCHRSP